MPDLGLLDRVEARVEALELKVPAPTVQKQKTSQFYYFQNKYRDRWAAFAWECIDWPQGKAPTIYQLDILDMFREDDRVSVRGLHGLGKTFIAAVVTLAFALTNDIENDWKVVQTASAWRQLTRYLWPEIHKWARQLRWDKIGRPPFNPRTELTTLALKLTTGEAFPVASNIPELIEGAHADHLCYVFDEAKVVPDATFDAAEGAFSGAGGPGGTVAKVMAISTPGPPIGRFYDIQTRKPGYEDWATRHVTTQEAIDAGRVSQVWVDQRAKQWGIKSAIYLNRVAGEFAADQEDSVIPLSWVERAIRRWYEWDEDGRPGEVNGIGLDVGISHDPSVFAFGVDLKVDHLEKIVKPDPDTATMYVAGLLKANLTRHQGARAYTDVIGIGAGVVHRVNEFDDVAHRNHAYDSRMATERMDSTNTFGFKNVRSAGWWIVRELLDPDNKNDVALPDVDELIGELTTPRFKYLSNGQIQVESKEDVKKRLHGRSTDNADAVIELLAGPVLVSDKVIVKWV